MPEPIDPVLTGDTNGDSIQGMVSDGFLVNVGAVGVADAPIGVLGDALISTYTAGFCEGDVVAGVLCDGLAGNTFEYFYRFLRGDALVGSVPDGYLNINAAPGFIMDPTGVDDFSHATRPLPTYTESQPQPSGSVSSSWCVAGSVESEFHQ